jgi:CheY-like chemotaxis protein
MPSVLVVDDSSVDRLLVGGLIEKDEELSVTFAANGTHALTLMRQSVPAIVVTDLVMPEMDGLELVTKIRDQYPFVPVILMTSKGNEQVAVQALERGAASYVPKSQLAQTLLTTIHGVLDASRPRQVQARLLSRMTEINCSFQLENDCTLFPPLIAYLQELVTRFELFDQIERVRLGVALEEALVNALYHGNLEIKSEMLEDNHDNYYALVEERCLTGPYKDRAILVDVHVTRERASFTIADQGPGFDPENLPDPTEEVNLDKISGRGVLLMRTFVDQLTYNERGSVVTMIKNRKSADSDALAYSEL